MNCLTFVSSSNKVNSIPIFIEIQKNCGIVITYCLLYSFDFGFDVEAEFEELLQGWMAMPDSMTDEDREFRAGRTETRKMVSEKMARKLRRRSFSESLCDVTFSFDLLSDGVKFGVEKSEKNLDKIKSGSCCLNSTYVNSENKNRETNSKNENENEKPCLWIVSQTPDLDPSRFLVQWLAASLSDIPLVMYQTRIVQTGPNNDNDDDNEDFGADIVASICAGVEERGWDAKQLLHALLDGGKTSIFDPVKSDPASIFDPVRSDPASIFDPVRSDPASIFDSASQNNNENKAASNGFDI